MIVTFCDRLHFHPGHCALRLLWPPVEMARQAFT